MSVGGSLLNGISSRDDFIAGDPVMLEMLKKAEEVAKYPVSVLIVGETGSGKSRLARFIHSKSGRSGNFVKVTSSELPDTLVESSLFGHARGAFTGANEDRDGFLIRANGGTLFLDEIGNFSPLVQSKMLGVLDSGGFSSVYSFYPVRGKTLVGSEFRLICATNKDLEECCKSGQFRWDLYYRINHICFRIPPLCQRLEDIEPLAIFFLSEISRWLKLDDILGITSEAIDLLKIFSWPGNVRQLQNALLHASIYRKSEVLELSDFDFLVPYAEIRTSDQSFESMMGRIKKEEINRIMMKNKGCVTGAAREIGISRAALYEAFAKLGIERTVGRIAKEDLLRLLEVNHWNYTEAAKASDISRNVIYYWIRKYKIKLPRRVWKKEKK